MDITPDTMIKHRQLEPELMDQPGLDRKAHCRALDGLRRLNSFSRTSALLWPAIRQLACRLAPEPVRILDVATGAGDIPLGIARLAQRDGLSCCVDGCDVSETAVRYASRFAKMPNVRFFELDAVGQKLPAGYDAVTCSLFLHHLQDFQAQELLRKMAHATKHLLLVSDLRRTRIGYALAWSSSRLLTRSPIVHVDAPRSVAAAFTIGEIAELAARSGLRSATVARRWPQRFLLRWRRRS